MKKLLLVLALFAVVGAGFVAGADDHEGTWTGEVVDVACYVAQGAHGAEHADCGTACVKRGQPMGLLTDDGTLVLLAADAKDGKPYESAKGMVGEKVQVAGHLAERGGMKVVTVKGAKAAG